MNDLTRRWTEAEKRVEHTRAAARSETLAYLVEHPDVDARSYILGAYAGIGLVADLNGAGAITGIGDAHRSALPTGGHS